MTTTFCLADRSTRLAAFGASLAVTRSFPLLFESRLADDEASPLAEATSHFVRVSLAEACPGRHFEAGGDPVLRYGPEILALPNRTPNGLILPKRENFLAYNELHACVARIVRGFKIDQLVESIQLPINVRVASGRPDPAVDRRPLASSKLHSDIWAGELPQTLTMFFPLLGDVERVGIVFAEPHERFLAQFDRPLADYDEGEPLTRGARPYASPLRVGHVYFTDPLLLHRTVKGADALRLSIDIRIRARERAAGDLEFDTDRSQNFVALEDWYGVGSSRLYVTEASMQDYAGGPPVPASKDAPKRYAPVTPYRLVAL